MGVKDFMKSSYNKIKGAVGNIKDKNEASNIYENQAKQFKIFNNNFNTSFYGNINYDTHELTCLSEAKLNEGDVIKDLSNNKMIKIVTIIKDARTFEHNIPNVEPFKLNLCKFNIV